MVHTLEDVVDRTIALARAENPGRNFGITLSRANAQALPHHSDRIVQGRSIIIGHIYRECLVSGITDLEDGPADALVIVSAVVQPGERGFVDNYYGDLRSGVVSRELPTDMGPRRR